MVGTEVVVGSIAEVTPLKTELTMLPAVGRMPSGVDVLDAAAEVPVPVAVPLNEIPDVVASDVVEAASEVVLVGEITPPGPNVIPLPVVLDAAAEVSAGVEAEVVVGKTTDEGIAPVDPTTASVELVSDATLWVSEVWAEVEVDVGAEPVPTTVVS